MKKTSRKIRFRLIAGILAGFMAVNSVAVSYAATEAGGVVSTVSEYVEDSEDTANTDLSGTNNYESGATAIAVAEEQLTEDSAFTYDDETGEAFPYDIVQNDDRPFEGETLKDERISEEIVSEGKQDVLQEEIVQEKEQISEDETPEDQDQSPKEVVSEEKQDDSQEEVAQEREQISEKETPEVQDQILEEVVSDDRQDGFLEEVAQEEKQISEEETPEDQDQILEEVGSDAKEDQIPDEDLPEEQQLVLEGEVPLLGVENNIYWGINEERMELKISSVKLSSDYTGGIYTFFLGQNPPWSSKSASIKNVIVGSETDIVAPDDLSRFFYGLDNATSFDLTGLDTSSAASFALMFSGCSQVSGLDLSGFDTSSATYMNGMFADCKNIDVLDLSSFDTSLLEHAERMFSGCDNLKQIKFGSWNTSRVVSMTNMFANCLNLTEADLSEFDTSHVVDMSNMFSGSGFETLDLSNFETSRVENMDSMFKDCKNLRSVNLTGFDINNVTSVQSMFRNCEKLEELDLSSFGKNKITSLWLTFENCPELRRVDLSNFQPAALSDLAFAFQDCSNLESVDLRNLDTHNLYRTVSMFYGCSSLQKIIVGSYWTVSAVTDSSSMFKGCSQLVGQEGTSYQEDHTDASYAHIDGGEADPGYLTGADGAVSVAYYWGINSAGELKISAGILPVEYQGGSFRQDLKPKKASEVPWHGVRDSVTSVIFGGEENILRPGSTAHWFENMSKIENFDFAGLDLSAARDTSYMFAGCRSLHSLDLRSCDTSNVRDMSYMFYNCTGLKDIVLKGIKVQSVSDMQYMFAYCSGLVSLDLSGLNTSRVRNMSGMFDGCAALENLDLAGLDTSSVTRMEYMFTGCCSLEELDLYSFDTHNVTAMTGMFWTGGLEESRLKTIYVGSKWNVDAVVDGDLVFMDCVNLVGGAGTVYNDNEVLVTYAHIDKGDENPGYLTDGSVKREQLYWGIDSNGQLKISASPLSAAYVGGSFDKDSVFTKQEDVPWIQSGKKIISVVIGGIEDIVTPCSTSWWFTGCGSLESADLEGLDTSEVTTMFGMFAYCGKLSSLDLSCFQTSKVTNMSSMFNNCSSLTQLDISSFDTSAVDNMAWMFEYCSSLQSLTLGTFDTSRVTNMRGMFRNTDKLESLNLKGLDTGNVTDMSEMFSQTGLKSIDLSGWDTGHVMKMSSLFYADKAEEIILGGWDTSNVTDMDRMFEACSNITTLDLSSFNTSKVTLTFCMFNNCSKLTTVFIGKGWDMDHVINSSSMFSNCYRIKGGSGTVYDKSKTSAFYARLDQAPDVPGYMSKGFFEHEGWIEENGRYRYYEYGEPVRNDWRFGDDAMQRWLDDDGYMAVNGFIYHQGKLYYVDEEGIRKTGWFELEECKYWADNDGVLAVDQTIEIEGVWYTFDKRGLLIKTMIGYGICGDNLTWGIVREGDKLVLEIIGYGEMYSYYELGTQPWIADSSRISALRISDEVTVIGGNAFSCLSGLSESVVLPKSLETIKTGAFIDCPCELVYDGTECDFNTNVHKEDGWENGVTLTYTGGKDHTFIDEIVPGSEGGVYHHKCSRCGFGYSLEYIFDEEEGVCAISKITCEGMEEITVPAIIDEYPVVSIMDNAAYMSDVRSVIIEDGVERLASGAFSSCKKLEEIILPESITRIDDSAFAGCEKLKSILIPSGVHQLNRTFSGCISLEEVILPNELEYIGPDTFRDCTALKTIHLPDSLQTIAYGAFNNCSSLTEINLPEALQTVESMAFMDCRGIKKVTVPKNCDYIQEQAFGYYYSKLYDEYRIVSGFSMRGYARSAAETYALERGIPFEVIEVPVSGLRLSENTYTLTLYYYGGGTGVLVPYIEPEEATDVTVLWSSSDESVVTVDSDGVMTAVGLGTAVITATTADGGFTAECSVTVEPEVPEFDGISIIQQDVVLEIGESSILTCEVLPPESMSMPAIVWSSSNPSIVSINRDTGEITGVAPGIVTITAFSDWYGYSSECTVTVKEKAVPVNGIQLDRQRLNLIEGDSQTLVVTVLPENATNKNVVWTSRDTSVAAVDESGKVTAVSPGVTTVVAETEDGGFKATCEVQVEARVYPVTGITLDRNSIVLLESDSFTLRATVSPDNATNKSISWQSSDINVAAVKQDGTVTGMKPGTATVTATTEDGGHTASCAVIVTAEAPEITDVSMTESGVKISWEEGAGSWPYTVFRKKNGGIWEKIGETSGTTFIDEKETLRDSYVYAIRRTGEFRADSASDKSFEVTQFRDMLDSSKYYYRHVYWAVNKGITNGYANAPDGPNKFRPEYNCTRAQMVTFLWREAGKPNPKSTKNPFKDVKSNQYYYKAVLWAAEKGITKGYSDGTFRPDDTCLREHAVTFLYRLAGKPKVKTTRNPFTDIKKSDYYYTPALWASEQGIANGYTEGGKKIYGPKRDCLREHIVTFLSRYDGKYGN